MLLLGTLCALVGWLGWLSFGWVDGAQTSCIQRVDIGSWFVGVGWLGPGSVVHLLWDKAVPIHPSGIHMLQPCHSTSCC
jgi:hypothetical protein